MGLQTWHVLSLSLSVYYVHYTIVSPLLNKGLQSISKRLELKEMLTRATMMMMEMREVVAQFRYQQSQCIQLGSPIIFISS